MKKGLKIGAASLAALMVVGATGCAVKDKDGEAWAIKNGWVKRDNDLETAATETESSGISIGLMDLDAQARTDLLKALYAGPFRWGTTVGTDKRTVPTELVGTPKYREMVVLGNTYNNEANVSTVEAVMDLQKYNFYMASETNTSKINQMRAHDNTSATITYVSQLNEKQAELYGDYAYQHSVMVYGKIHVFTPADAEKGAKYMEDLLRCLDIYMPTYYPDRWQFPVMNQNNTWDYSQDPNLDAKLTAAKTIVKETEYTTMYEIVPDRIVVSIMSTVVPSAITAAKLYNPVSYFNYIKYSTTKYYDAENQELSSAEGAAKIVHTGYEYDKYIKARVEDGSANPVMKYYYPSTSDWTNKYYDIQDNVSRTELLKATSAFKDRWLAKEENVTKMTNAYGEENLSFTRYVLAKNVENVGDKGEEIVQEQLTGLTAGVDYYTEEFNLPNYSVLLLKDRNLPAGIHTQSNILFDN